MCYVHFFKIELLYNSKTRHLNPHTFQFPSSIYLKGFQHFLSFVAWYPQKRIHTGNIWEVWNQSLIFTGCSKGNMNSLPLQKLTSSLFFQKAHQRLNWLVHRERYELHIREQAHIPSGRLWSVLCILLFLFSHCPLSLSPTQRAIENMYVHFWWWQIFRGIISLENCEELFH